jgi:glycosyltransferase involved in cell wall biosynthesis
MLDGFSTLQEYQKTMKIEPISSASDAARPFWSVMIPAFNRTEYIETLLNSILEQNIPAEQMHIEVVENAPINPRIGEIVERVGKGRIGHFGQPSKMRYTRNWTTCLQRSRGEWVHFIHDDDYILPGFYQTYMDQIRETPHLELIGSQSKNIQSDGNEIGPYVAPRKARKVKDQRIFKQQLLLHNFLPPPAVVLKRELIERIGGYSNIMFYGADWEFWTRAASQGQVGFIDKTMSCYRVQSNSKYRRHRLKFQEPMLQRLLGSYILRDELDMKTRMQAKANIMLEGGFTALTAAREKGWKFSANIALKAAGNNDDLLEWLYSDMASSDRDDY